MSSSPLPSPSSTVMSLSLEPSKPSVLSSTIIKPTVLIWPPSTSKDKKSGAMSSSIPQPPPTLLPPTIVKPPNSILPPSLSEDKKISNVPSSIPQPSPSPPSQQSTRLTKKEARTKRTHSSKHALHRERIAKELFTKEKIEFEKSKGFSSLVSGEIEGFLKPDCHLTCHTWPSFRNWVENEHPGWTVARRRTTNEEDLKDSNARGKKFGYFVDAFYQDPTAPIDKKKKKKKTIRNIVDKSKIATNKTNKKPCKKRKASDDDIGTRKKGGINNTVAKRAKFSNNTSKPADSRQLVAKRAGYYSLPDSVLLKVFSYVSPSTLQVIARVAPEPIVKAVTNDELWIPHLRRMIVNRFDSAFQAYGNEGEVVPSPLSQRPLKSTSFRTWWNDWETYFTLHGDNKDDVNGKDKGVRMNMALPTVRGNPMELFSDYIQNQQEYLDLELDGQFQWLLNDVRLIEYYRRANDCADFGEQHYY